jgi:glyoxylase-like metal-dependent hydrolase (beta-lactamase superfamily II)
MAMVFEQVRTGGCLSYVIGCEETRAAVIVDPEARQLERYRSIASTTGLSVRYLVDTHTHADHFSGVHELARRLDVPSAMHRNSAAPFVDVRLDDGDMLLVGNLRVQVMHTPGHTDDSMVLRVDDRLLTGDTLLIGGTGRTDLPTGDAAALHESLFEHVLRLPDTLRVFPAHDYHGRSSSTLGEERATNPRLQRSDREAFVEMMKSLDLEMPAHLTEALRTNRTGGKTVAQLIAEAARAVPFMSMDELRARVERGDPDLLVLDVRERSSFDEAHIPGAMHIPRGLLELRVDATLPDPTARVLAYCDFGKISTLAAATLRSMGYTRAVALDGGMKAWIEKGFPTEPAA